MFNVRKISAPLSRKNLPENPTPDDILNAFLGVCLTYNFTQNQHVESSALANTVYGSRFSRIPESYEFGAIYLLPWCLTTTT